MEYPVRKHPRLKHYDYSQNGWYFITICTKNRAPLFWAPSGCLSPAGEVALDCLEDIPAHIQGVSVDICCVMPDHVHAILIIESVGPPYMAADRSKQTLSRAIQQYKAAVSRRCGQKGIWQSGFYDHIIRQFSDLEETRRYIANNPLRRKEGNG